ncbi:MAG TPA: hypothetical protein VH307_03990 [Streptosporangiaceae bacterium]|jgi:hypothetical protein|nr:hypothetical protein [Streptosporangiaceae bacterium]
MITPKPPRNLALLAVSAGALAVIAACGSVSKANAPAATTPPVAAPAATTAPSPAPSPTSTLTGPVGTVYQVTDDSGNKMTVTLTRMIDPALGADQFSTPNNGFRFVGAVFTLKGVSGTFSDDANSDATVVGSNIQSYTADFNSIAGVTNFNHGEFNLTPGTTSIGAVTFQVPDGVKVASVQWSGSIFGGAPAAWVVPATPSSGTSAGAWATVSAYYQDITSKNYAAAWRLLGYNPQGGGYASFVAGYANTGTQTVTETSASGDQVSFTLTSDNPDGTVQTYTGTDTVTGGRIIAASVTQTG